jgi:FkbM family methyltransferase
MTISQEWASIRGLLRARRQPATVIERDADGRSLWDTAMGRFWTPKGAGADYVQRLATEMHAGVYDLGGSERDFVCLDCGGNVGFFTRFALDSGARLVIAFEPSPENAYCFRKNLAPELSAGKVILIEKGVWDRETTLSFSTVNTNNPGDHHIVEGETGDIQVGNIQVPVTSIDTVARELSLPKVDYIKIDVEGAETRAIAGARELIGRDKPRICVATEHTDDMFANTVAVIESVRKVAPQYDYVCTEAHPYTSPSRGLVLTPFSILFQ